MSTFLTQALNQSEYRIGSHVLHSKGLIAEGIKVLSCDTYMTSIVSGAFGVVELVVDHQTQIEYALKRCNVNNAEKLEIVKNEIKVLQLFSSPNIIAYHGSELVRSQFGQEAYVLLSYCPGGNLLDRVIHRNAQPFPYITVLSYFYQILMSVLPLHSHEPPIIHFDLKLENILFSKADILQLCDFGSCSTGYLSLRSQYDRATAEEKILKETTPIYRAPEMIDLFMRDELTEKTDVWALGCILYSLCFLKHPFQDAGNLGILSCSLSFPPEFEVPESSQRLISLMLDIDPEGRPKVEELVYFVSELIEGNPLPQYQVSAEVLEKREKRIQANNAKQTKKVKKSFLPNRAVHSLDANSVAARRLAAKKAPNDQGDRTNFIEKSTLQLEVKNSCLVFDPFDEPLTSDSPQFFEDKFISPHASETISNTSTAIDSATASATASESPTPTATAANKKTTPNFSSVPSSTPTFQSSDQFQSMLSKFEYEDFNHAPTDFTTDFSFSSAFQSPKSATFPETDDFAKSGWSTQDKLKVNESMPQDFDLLMLNSISFSEANPIKPSVDFLDSSTVLKPSSGMPPSSGSTNSYTHETFGNQTFLHVSRDKTKRDQDPFATLFNQKK